MRLHTRLRYAPAEIRIEKRADGTQVLRSPQPLGSHARAVGDWLVHWYERAPERTFLAERKGDGWRRVSYRDALSDARRIGQALLNLGLDASRPVAILSDNSVEHALLALGAMHVGVPVAPISPAYSLMSKDFAKLKSIFELLRPGLVFAAEPEKFAGALAAVGATSTPVARLLETNPGSTLEVAFSRLKPETVAKILFTSGSTGAPKGVSFSHRQIVLHTLAVLGAISSAAHGQSFRHGDVYMPMTPLFHVHAWGNPYLATLLGVKQVYPGRYVPEQLLALRAREGVTYSHCVPTILQMLLSAADKTGADLRGWKICIGGSALPVGLARDALRRGIDVFAGYGMSETGPVLAISRLLEPAGSLPEDAELERRCRTGLPVPLVDLRLGDAGSADVPRDGRSVGEILVRAPWTTMAYVGDAEASEALWRGGYLHTQDVALIDAQGYLQITDRIKDVIKTGGEWLSSLELESLISQHPGVAEVAVIATPDARWGERPHAVVVPRADWRDRLGVADIQEHVAAAAASGTVPRFAVPERVTLVDELAKTSVGKINKRVLRERYG